MITNDGRVLADSPARPGEQLTDLAALVLTNTATGAASLVRRSLLDLALPFPRRSAAPITITGWPARRCPRSDRVRRPAAPGLRTARGASCWAWGAGRRPAGRAGPRRRPVPPAARRRARATSAHARRYYEEELLWRRALAGELERRFGLLAAGRGAKRAAARRAGNGPVGAVAARSQRETSAGRARPRDREPAAQGDGVALDATSRQA